MALNISALRDHVVVFESIIKGLFLLNHTSFFYSLSFIKKRTVVKIKTRTVKTPAIGRRNYYSIKINGLVSIAILFNRRVSFHVPVPF